MSTQFYKFPSAGAADDFLADLLSAGYVILNSAQAPDPNGPGIILAVEIKPHRTYYRIVSPADLTMSGKKQTRIQARRPTELELRGGDLVYVLHASSIADARAAKASAWVRKSTLEL